MVGRRRIGDWHLVDRRQRLLFDLLVGGRGRSGFGIWNALTLDLTDVEAGSYVLLVQVWDHEDVLFERARRVEISK